MSNQWAKFAQFLRRNLLNWTQSLQFFSNSAETQHTSASYSYRSYTASFVTIYSFLSKIWAIYAQKLTIISGLPCQIEWSVVLWAQANNWFIHSLFQWITQEGLLYVIWAQNEEKVSNPLTKFPKSADFHQREPY